MTPALEELHAAEVAAVRALDVASSELEAAGVAERHKEVTATSAREQLEREQLAGADAKALLKLRDAAFLCEAEHRRAGQVRKEAAEKVEAARGDALRARLARLRVEADESSARARVRETMAPIGQLAARIADHVKRAGALHDAATAVIEDQRHAHAEATALARQLGEAPPDGAQLPELLDVAVAFAEAHAAGAGDVALPHAVRNLGSAEALLEVLVQKLPLPPQWAELKRYQGWAKLRDMAELSPSPDDLVAGLLDGTIAARLDARLEVVRRRARPMSEAVKAQTAAEDRARGLAAVEKTLQQEIFPTWQRAATSMYAGRYAEDGVGGAEAERRRDRLDGVVPQMLAAAEEVHARWGVPLPPREQIVERFKTWERKVTYAGTVA